MYFGQFLDSWFRLTYYLCVIPFKITKNGKAYISTSYFPQKVLCIIFQTACFGVTFCEYWILFNSHNVRNQGFLTRFIERLNSIGYCLLLFYFVWWRPESILRILGRPDQIPEGNVRRWSTVFTILYLCCSIFLFVSWFTYFGQQKMDVEHLIVLRVNNFICIFINPEEASASTLFAWKILAVSYFVGRLYKWLIIDHVMGLNILVSFATLSSARKFEQLLEISSPQSDLDEAEVFEHYSELEEAVTRFNEFPGPTTVSIFTSLIMYCAVSVGDTLNSKTWNFTCYIPFYFCMTTIPFVLGAEAHFKISRFTKWLLSRPKRSVSTITEFLTTEHSNLALRGGRFFSITYSFLGTACSVMLTYAIITIQSRDNNSQFWTE